MQNGYINGYGDNTFRADAPITRAQACVIIARANRLATDKASTSKLASLAPDWALKSVSLLYDAKIISGYHDGSLGLEKNISRAEAVALLKRTQDIEPKLEKIVESGINASSNEMKKSQAKNSDTKKLKLKISENKKPEVKKPEIKKNEVQKPEIKKSEVKKPEVKKPDFSPSSGFSGGTSNSAPIPPTVSQVPTPSVPRAPEPKVPELKVPEPKQPAPSVSVPSVPTPSVPEVSVPSQEPPKESDAKEKDATSESGANSNSDTSEAGGDLNSATPESKETPPTSPAPQTPPVVQNSSTESSPSAPRPPKRARKPKPSVESENLTPEQKAQKLKTELSSRSNPVTQFEMEEGDVRTVLWTKGIEAPQWNEFVKDDTTPDYLVYKLDYIPNKGWYDTNKASEGTSSVIDRNMCFAAVSSNMLHWWMDQNKAYIQKLVEVQEKKNVLNSNTPPLIDFRRYINSFENQNRTQIFEMFKVYFGNTNHGYHPNVLMDLFINGYKQKNPNASGGNGGYYLEDDYNINDTDSRGGFFKDAIGKHRLTKIMAAGGYDAFSRQIKRSIMDGEIVGVTHTHLRAGIIHVITVWGVEFDLDSNVVAVYISDSDDYGQPNVGMQRYEVRKRQEQGATRPIIGTKISDKTAGSVVESFYTLSLGQEHWEKYIENLEVESKEDTSGDSKDDGE